jgi:hypothetical protein
MGRLISLRECTTIKMLRGVKNIRKSYWKRSSMKADRKMNLSKKEIRFKSR